MKYVVLFIFCVFIGFGGFVFYRRSLLVQTKKTPVVNVKPFSIDTPPTRSLQGRITQLSGENEWQSRSSTEPAKLSQKPPVLQGEEYWTKENGTLQFEFPNVAAISLEKNSHINFIQTLPDHFVVAQDSGAAAYKLYAAAPLSIRSQSLLIQQNAGELTLQIEDTRPFINITITKGSATIAFNNADNISTLVTIQEGTKYVFNTETKAGREL